MTRNKIVVTKNKIVVGMPSSRSYRNNTLKLPINQSNSMLSLCVAEVQDVALWTMQYLPNPMTNWMGMFLMLILVWVAVFLPNSLK